MAREELEDELLRYEDEYASMCEFNNFSDKDSEKYLKKIEEIRKKLENLKVDI